MSTTIRPRDPSEGAARPMRGRLTSPTRASHPRHCSRRRDHSGRRRDAGRRNSPVRGGSSRSPERQQLAGFTAIAASSADALEVPAGFRADVLISWGDLFRGSGGPALRYGFNNDFLAYFPLKGSREGLLFVNHEYPDPFFLHGYKPTGAPKTPAQVQEEQDSVGHTSCTSGVAVTALASGVASEYNRRIYGDRPDLEFTGPLTGAAGIGESAHGSLGNCSGGITPWGTALSCEENFDGYGTNVANNLDIGYGWHQWGGQPEDAEYEFTVFKKYGWVCEHDPYDPEYPGRKHTALGRFRHENTAFRHEPGSRFVLYMGDDKANEGVYKFVSKRRFRPRQGSNNRRILRRARSTSRAGSPRSPPLRGRRRHQPDQRDRRNRALGSGPRVCARGHGHQAARDLRRRVNAHFATNRPEDLEVRRTGACTSPSPTTAR